MTTLFIAERPTQIVTAIAICEMLGGGKSPISIVVADRFTDAAEIVSRFSNCFGNINFELVPSYEHAISIAEQQRPTHLFIHWDVGFGTQLRLRRLRKLVKRISVFDEGIGTYRQNLYPPFKKKVFRAIGLPVNIGASRYVDDIYVYDKEKYLAAATKTPAAVHEISKRLDDILREYQMVFMQVFSADSLITEMKKAGKNQCCIYLSSYEFDEAGFIDILDKEALNILKLHPHTSVKPDLDEVLHAPPSLPAELLISIASGQFNSVTVYHHGSSSTLHIQQANVNAIDLS